MDLHAVDAFERIGGDIQAKSGPHKFVTETPEFTSTRRIHQLKQAVRQMLGRAILQVVTIESGGEEVVQCRRFKNARESPFAEDDQRFAVCE